MTARPNNDSPCSVFLVEAPQEVNPAHFALLSKQEKSRCSRFRNEEHRARYTCAHALLRLTLAARLDRSVKSLTLKAGRNQRPELAPELAAQHPGMDFNLSTTPGFAACVIGQGVRVGIDIERARPGRTVTQLKGEVLSHREQGWLEQSDNPADFFRLWTLKEAVAKADGEGLGLPFKQLEILPLDDGSLNLDLHQVTQEGNWRVVALQSNVPAALAITGPDCSGKIILNNPVPATFRAVPLSIGAQGTIGQEGLRTHSK